MTDHRTLNLNRTLSTVSWLLVSVVFAGCVSTVPIGEPVGVTELDAQLTKVAFVSLRAIERDGEGRSYYGNWRGETSTGFCTVEPGRSDDGRVASVQLRPAEDLLGQFAATHGRIVVYVHGFNISFKKGCQRAALLQERLGLDGRLLLFSWPADGRFTNYVRDLADLEWSVVLLQEVVMLLAERFGHRNIDVVSHSMGAKGLVAAMSAIGRETSERFGQMILVAPDIDSEVFARDYGDLHDVVSRITIYVSDSDRALRLSRELHGYARLGEAGTHTSQLNGIDIVDVSELEVQRTFGHLYHVYNDVVIEDIRTVLAGEQPASPRALTAQKSLDQVENRMSEQDQGHVDER
jgi:esterase/lipase superfamily enzyme